MIGLVEPCIFCGQPGGSREHVWPDWVARFLTSGRPDWQVELTKLGSPLIVVENVARELEITADCVCARCNGRWMKRLEDRVSVFAKPMILGESTALRVDQRKVLARWAAKTAITLECRYESLHTTPAEIRHQVRLRSELPRQVEVWLGMYQGPQMLSSTRIVLQTIDAAGVIASWSTLLLGKLLMQVRIDPRWVGIRPKVEETERCTPLFGDVVGKVVAWPPQLACDDDYIARYRDWFVRTETHRV